MCDGDSLRELYKLAEFGEGGGTTTSTDDNHLCIASDGQSHPQLQPERRTSPCSQGEYQLMSSLSQGEGRRGKGRGGSGRGEEMISLSLANWSLDPFAVAIFIGAFPARFERLNLSQCGGVDDTVATCLTEADSCRTLRSLVLNGAYITDAGVLALSAAPWLPALTELSLHGCREIKGEEALGVLCAALRDIASLSLARLRATALTTAVLRLLCCRGDGSLLSIMPGAAEGKKLRKLRLDHSRGVNAAGVACIASSLNHLHELSIRGCVLVGNAGLTALATGVPSLRRLHLGRGSSSSAGASRGCGYGSDALAQFQHDRPKIMLC